MPPPTHRCLSSCALHIHTYLVFNMGRSRHEVIHVGCHQNNSTLHSPETKSVIDVPSDTASTGALHSPKSWGMGWVHGGGGGGGLEGYGANMTIVRVFFTHTHTHTHTHTLTHTHTQACRLSLSLSHTHTHSHKHAGSLSFSLSLTHTHTRTHTHTHTHTQACRLTHTHTSVSIFPPFLLCPHFLFFMCVCVGKNGGDGQLPPPPSSFFHLALHPCTIYTTTPTRTCCNNIVTHQFKCHKHNNNHSLLRKKVYLKTNIIQHISDSSSTFLAHNNNG